MACKCGNNGKCGCGGNCSCKSNNPKKRELPTHPAVAESVDNLSEFMNEILKKIN